MSGSTIMSGPTLTGAATLLESVALPTADLTEGHMKHFFYIGSGDAPVALAGVEFWGENALLRSLVVATTHRLSGVGSRLLIRAENHAYSSGARSMLLLTTTAQAFFEKRGYRHVDPMRAPGAMRATHEFSDVGPMNFDCLMKALRT